MRLVASIALLAALCVGVASAENIPVGLVTAPGGSQLRRAGTDLPIAARSGDLLFDGDSITGSATLWFCPTREALTLAPGSVVVAGSQRLRLAAGSFSKRASLPVCALPPVDRAKLADVRFYGVGTRGAAPRRTTGQRRDIAELAAVDAILAKDPANIAALVARAAVLQRHGLHSDAAAEYQRIAEAWRDVDWPRQLVHEEEDAERRTGAAGMQEERLGKTYALVVGISRYAHLRPEEQLKFAHRDATVFAGHLQTPRGGALPADQVRLLTDEHATTAAVRNGIATFLRARAGKQDTVILFIAAHGIVDSRGAYVVTADSDLEDLQTTALSMLEVQRVMEEEFAHVGRVMLYVDICRAGTIGTIRRNNIGRFVDMLLAGQTAETFGLLASRPGEVSVEHTRFGGGHGAFSYFLLRGLNGEADENHDGTISAGELVDYVRAKVREATRNQQTPRESGTLPASAVLARGLELPGIELADWRPLDDALAAQRRELGTSASFDEQERQRIELQDKGQQVLLRYLRGDQVPQQRSDFEAGEGYFRAALELDPGAWALQSRTLFCRGRVQIFDRRYREAVEILERASRIDPGGAYILNALGIAYLETADYPRATLAFRDATSVAPHWVYPVHNLALTLAEQGDFAGAVKTYQRATRLAPEASYLPYNLGLLYQRLNRRKDAESAFLLASKLAPAASEPLNALGSLKLSAGKPKDAEALFRRALQNSPKSIEARHNLALAVSRESGRTAEAIALWREIAAGEPEFLPSRLSLAETLAREGRTAEAIREYQAVIRLQPESAGARIALADLLLKENIPGQAAEEIRIALRQKPGNALLLERLGDAEEASGHAAEARAAWRAALEKTKDAATRRRILGKLR